MTDSGAPLTGTGSHADAPSPDGLGSSSFDPSRVPRCLEQFRSAQIAARAITAAAEQAAPAEKAAKWFSDYGPKCVGKDAGSISWHPAFAGSCVGAKEAAAYIQDAAVMMMPTIIEEAERLAEGDMLKLMSLLPSDNDGSPKGGDGLPGSVHDGVGPKDIAKDTPS